MRGLGVVVVLGLVLLEALGHDAEPYELNLAGRSAGIPPCSGQADAANCYRTDEPLPPDVCVRRDPDTKACLETMKITTYESEHLAKRAEAQHVLLEQSFRGLPRTCDFQDPTCVPDGIHLTQNIDWRQVEGAEFLTGTRLSSEGLADIYVDVNHGDDHRGRGTRESPYKSIKSGLRRWLKPGKCHPYCSSTALTSSATLHLAEGVYAGSANTEIEMMVVQGVNVVIQCNELGNKDRTFETKRRSNVEIKVTDFSYWLSASGKGSLALLGLTITNTSSEALKVSGVAMKLDLHYRHGIFGSVKQSLVEGTNSTNGTNTSIVRSPNWDVAVDQRVLGKKLNCDSPVGCIITGKDLEFDQSRYGKLPPSSEACEHCHVAVKGHSIESIPTTGYGLGVAVKEAGSSCQNGGTLLARHRVSGKSGSGFSATFSVSNGAISGVTIVDPGSGYRSAEDINIEIDIGGDSCSGISFIPFLVYDSSYVT